MGIENIGGATAGAAGAAAPDYVPVSGGIAVIERAFEPGVYLFEFAAEGLAALGTRDVEFYDAGGSLIIGSTLEGANNVGSIVLDESAASFRLVVNFDTGLFASGLLTITFGPAPTGIKNITSVPSTDASYTTTFIADVFVFGGGGSGGGSYGANDRGGGGGGSGYLTKSVSSAPIGTYAVTIGAGAASPGTGNGTTGGTTTFGNVSYGTLTALGGEGGLSGTSGTGDGGDGGSGGGGGEISGSSTPALGGTDGANGETNGLSPGGTGSGVSIGTFYLPPSFNSNTTSGAAGGFYAGGNGGAGTGSDINGKGAGDNSASGGGGGYRGSGRGNGGGGGSGVVYLVEV